VAKHPSNDRLTSAAAILSPPQPTARALLIEVSQAAEPSLLIVHQPANTALQCMAINQ
jgi:hypothetical protein